MQLNDCLHRFKTCNFCDIDIKASLLPAHVDMCSSRTERCDDCGQFIMLKYLALHKESHRLKKIPNGKNYYVVLAISFLVYLLFL